MSLKKLKERASKKLVGGVFSSSIKSALSRLLPYFFEYSLNNIITKKYIEVLKNDPKLCEQVYDEIYKLSEQDANNNAHT